MKDHTLVAAERSYHHEEIDLARVWGQLVDGRILIAAIAAAVVIFGALYALLATPIYRADVLLQVEKKQGGVPGFVEVSQLLEQESSAVGEIEILRSRMVLGEAVQALGMDVSLRRLQWPLIGRFSAPSPASEPGPLFRAVVDADTDIRVAEFVVPPALYGQPFELMAYDDGYMLRLGGVDILRATEGGQAQSEDGRIQLSISHFRARAGDRFELTRYDPLAVISRVRDGFAVSEQGRNSGILSVSFAGTSPARARAILDAIADAYLMQNIKRMSAEAEKSLEFLEQQLPDIRAALERAETFLNEFRLESGSVDLTLETQQVLSRLVVLEAKENELLFQEKELARLYTREHPAFRTLLQQQQAVIDEKARLGQQIKTLPDTQQEVLRLTRDVHVNQEIYVQMLNKSQELRVVRAGTVGNVRIIDRAATAAEPIRPRRGMIMALSLIFGSMFGVGTVLIRAAFFRGIETPAQIEEVGLPVYAAVPLSQRQTLLSGMPGRRRRTRMDARGSVLALADPADLAVESLRSLRTSLHFAMMDADNRVLMVSGPSPGVGKSFVSANLAVVLAQVNNRVLLIDADMRKGRLHHDFNLSSKVGLSSWLAGQTSLEQVIQATAVSNLGFIPRGEAPPNPAELLMHPRFAALIEAVSDRYDLVIIDTPPVLAVTDAAIVGQYAGTSLLVTRFGKNSAHEVDVANRRFAQNGVQIKGAILNCMEKRAANAYGYYAYAYGDNTASKD
ncbi:MAG: polysaccharide biosynthesis tyrosine autokinase [Alcanivoracaceae bacterium]